MLLSKVLETITISAREKLVREAEKDLDFRATLKRIEAVCRMRAQEGEKRAETWIAPRFKKAVVYWLELQGVDCTTYTERTPEGADNVSVVVYWD